MSTVVQSTAPVVSHSYEERPVRCRVGFVRGHLDMPHGSFGQQHLRIILFTVYNLQPRIVHQQALAECSWIRWVGEDTVMVWVVV
jgi:hypothetical protein